MPLRVIDALGRKNGDYGDRERLSTLYWNAWFGEAFGLLLVLAGVAISGRTGIWIGLFGATWCLLCLAIQLYAHWRGGPD